MKTINSPRKRNDLSSKPIHLVEGKVNHSPGQSPDGRGLVANVGSSAALSLKELNESFPGYGHLMLDYFNRYPSERDRYLADSEIRATMR